jgi:hypothetical protein
MTASSSSMEDAFAAPPSIKDLLLSGCEQIDHEKLFESPEMMTVATNENNQRTLKLLQLWLKQICVTSHSNRLLSIEVS